MSDEQAWHAEQAIALANWTRAIALTESVEQAEIDVAATLRSLAGSDSGAAAARRRRLADEADAGAQAAAKAKNRMQQQARSWADHADIALLGQAAGHAAALLTELADAEKRIASLLSRLADRDKSEGAERRRQLSAAASAAARRDLDRRRALRQLTETEAAQSRPARTPRPKARRRPTAAIKPPNTDQAVPHQAQAPDGYRQHSVADVERAARAAETALRNAASAHDRAAEAEERSAGAGIGDVAEHRRRAAHHRAAAAADRERHQMVYAEPAEQDSAD